MMEKRRYSPPLLFLPALLGMLTVVISTWKGPGIGGDATIYIESARNLLDGPGLGLVGAEGEFRLLPYFPPFFSLVLAFFGLLGTDLVLAAQGLNVVLFGGLIAMMAFLSYRATDSVLISVLLALCAAISPVLIPVYSWAMSEPLSIFLGFAGLCFVLRGLSAPARNGNWVAGGLLTGLSFLTRYGSAAFLAAWALLILLRGQSLFLKRLRNAVLFSAAGAFPMLVWVLFDLTHTATVGSRSLESGAEIARRLAGFWPAVEKVILFWLVPESWIDSPPYPLWVNPIAVLALCVTALGLFIYLLRNRVVIAAGSSQQTVDLLLALGIFSAVYGLVVLGVYLFTYPPITLGSRMFSPVHIAVIWAAGLCIDLVRKRAQEKVYSKWLPLGLVLLLGWYGIRSVRIVEQNYALGLGYNSIAWQQSETIDAVRNLPVDTLIVTNEETALIYLAARPSLAFQEIYRDIAMDRFTRYGDEPIDSDAAQQTFRRGEALLVLFDSVDDQLAGIYGDQTAQRVAVLTQGLKEIYHGADGAIYAYPD